MVKKREISSLQSASPKSRKLVDGVMVVNKFLDLSKKLGR